MLTFLAIDVIKEIDTVFHDAVTHIAVITTHIHKCSIFRPFCRYNFNNF